MLSALLAKPLQALGAVGVVVMLLVAAYFGGRHFGASDVKARWDTAKATQAAKQDAVSAAVTTLSERLVATVQDRLDTLEHAHMEAIDVAKQADAVPAGDACRDARRGLPAGVVRSIDRVR